MKVLTGSTGGLVKAWVDGVEFEDAAQKQVLAVSELPFIFKHVVVLPDVLGRLICELLADAY